MSGLHHENSPLHPTIGRTSVTKPKRLQSILKHSNRQNYFQETCIQPPSSPSTTTILHCGIQQHQQQSQFLQETCLAMPDVTLALKGSEVSELLLTTKKQPLFIVPAPDESLFVHQQPSGLSMVDQQEKMPDIANMNERKQPDGEVSVVLVKSEMSLEDNTHHRRDQDYLLKHNADN